MGGEMKGRLASKESHLTSRWVALGSCLLIIGLSCAPQQSPAPPRISDDSPALDQPRQAEKANGVDGVSQAALPREEEMAPQEIPPDRPPVSDARPPEETPDDGYTGPLDPIWPPEHTADLEVELRVSDMLRAREAAGQEASLDEGPLLSGDTPGVYARRGTIAGFEYLEVILGDVEQPDTPLPLVVLFHGRGGRPHIPQGAFSPAARLRILFPQGPDPMGSGHHWLATYTNSGKIEVLTRSLSARIDQLAVMIEAFRQLRPTIGRPALAGFSQGGIITYALAARFPARYSGAFPIAGWLPPLLLPAANQPGDRPRMVAFHGDRDAVVPTALGRQTAAEMKDRGFSIRYEEHQGVAHVVTEAINLAVRREIADTLREEVARAAALGISSPAYVEAQRYPSSSSVP